MSRPVTIPVEKKLRIVLQGEVLIAEAVRWEGFLSRRLGTGNGSSLKVTELGSRRVSPSRRPGSSSWRLRSPG